MQPQPANEPSDQSNRKKTLLWTILGLVLLLVISTGAYALGRKNAKPQATSVSVATASPSPEISATPTPKATPSSVTQITDPGVTWLDSPQKLSDLKLFKAPDGRDPNEPYEVKYYKVGTDNGKDIILALVPPEGPSGDMEALLVKKSASEYELLSKHSPDLYFEGKLTVTLAKSVTANNQTNYKSLAPQETLIYKGTTLKGGFTFISLFDDLKKLEQTTLTEVSKTPFGILYSQTRGESSGTVLQTFVLKRPNNTIRIYQSRPTFFGEDNVPIITWNDGAKNKDAYRLDGFGGCGAPSHLLMTKDGKLDGLKATGKTNANESVYEFSDPKNPIVQEVYKLAVPDGKYYSYNQTTGESKEMSISVEEYLAKHGIVAYKDALNRVILFINTVYGSPAECGKPVVYLYPTQTSQVSVKVDADVTVSDPAYNGGWTVKAEPSGKLTNQDGKTYDSLFWEGLGRGEYPAITQGFVVEKGKIESTLREHLKKLGLNDKESNDFMEFWLPKMPNTPYVRLTWFGTRAMDRLAPLTISPKPDSIIRIFLDFEGLNTPINLPTQRLSSIPRKGFTVIEWGGLLRK